MKQPGMSRFRNFRILSGKQQWHKFAPGIVWFFILLALICLPGYDLPHPKDWFKQLNGDKLIHIGCFALLVYLFSYPINTIISAQKEKRNYFIRIALAASVWGLTTELIQKYFVPSRSFDWLDFTADVTGAMIAFWFCYRRFLK